MADSYSIQISSNLIDKLTTRESKAKKTSKKPKPKALEKPKQPDDKSNPAPMPPAEDESGGWPLQSSEFFPGTPAPAPVDPAVSAELEAIRAVLLESERVKQKLEKQDANLTKELTERAKELREKEFRLPYQNIVPCAAEREDCLNCYKEHLKNPLKCSGLVKSFSNCARQARQADSDTSQ